MFEDSLAAEIVQTQAENLAETAISASRDQPRARLVEVPPEGAALAKTVSSPGLTKEGSEAPCQGHRAGRRNPPSALVHSEPS